LVYSRNTRERATGAVGAGGARESPCQAVTIRYYQSLFIWFTAATRESALQAQLEQGGAREEQLAHALAAEGQERARERAAAAAGALDHQVGSGGRFLY